jgi:pilus assembly protein Flp/PilA
MHSHFVYITNFLADRLRRDDRGATAVEYGLIVALIAAAIIAIVLTLGQQIAAAFTAVSSQIPF